MSPVPVQPDRLAMVFNNQQILVLDLPGGRVNWKYRGPTSRAHAEPDLIGGPGWLIAVIDGDSLVRLDVTNGARLWSTRLGSVPVANAHEVAAWDDTSLYIISGGILRSVSIKSGQLRWEQYVGDRASRWRTQVIGGYVVAWPADEKASAGQSIPIVIHATATGEAVQRLYFEGGPVAFHSRPRGAVVAAGDRIYGLGSMATGR
jgi:outer membrane protein assembly factor BamB